MRTFVKVAALGWNALMALWVLVAVSNLDECNTEACETGQGLGVMIGLVMVAVIATAGNAVLGLLWLLGRPKQESTAATVQASGGRWAVDPLGRHEMRYWDGSTWTASVSDQGALGTDPLVPST